MSEKGKLVVVAMVCIAVVDIAACHWIGFLGFIVTACSLCVAADILDIVRGMK
jgi:hypothetical protein